MTDTLRKEVKGRDAETFKADAQKLTDTSEAPGNDKLEIKVEKLKDGPLASMITVSRGEPPDAG